MLEKHIEQNVCKHAKTKNFIVEKWGKNGNPDRIFISPKGIVLFIEFKSKKNKLTKLQDEKIKKLLQNNTNVFIVNSVEYGINIIDNFNV